jgi:hypothetical protein
VILLSNLLLKNQTLMRMVANSRDQISPTSLNAEQNSQAVYTNDNGLGEHTHVGQCCFETEGAEWLVVGGIIKSRLHCSIVTFSASSTHYSYCHIRSGKEYHTWKWSRLIVCFPTRLMKKFPTITGPYSERRNGKKKIPFSHTTAIDACLLNQSKK